MSGPILAFRDVGKTFPQEGGGPRVVLDHASIEVFAGRKIAIVGRSGSGKSTLLHLAAGIDLPSSGSVELLGRDLARLSDRERTLERRRSVGLIFQFFHLLPHLDVRDNVALPGMIAEGRPSEYEARAAELLAKVGLETRARDSVQKLSGGEMQRVAICRALLRRPRLLLADEPTGNLDDETSRTVMDLLAQLTEEEGSALLFVTHSAELAARADEVWRIAQGALERVPGGAP